MAKSKDGKKEEYPYPSHYGSHASMVDLEETKKMEHRPDLVVCRDEYGLYVTEPHHLDSRLADPNRHLWHEYRTEKFREIAGQLIEIVQGTEHVDG